jgi:subtilisin
MFTGVLFALVLLPNHSTASNEPETRYVITGPDPSALKSMVESAGGKVITPLRYQSGWVVELGQTQTFELQARLNFRALTTTLANTFSGTNNGPKEILERDGEVVLINSARPAVVSDDDSLRYSQKTPWNIQAVRAPDAFSVSRGKGAVVCIIDTGVQKDHPDLEGAVIGGESTVSSYHAGYTGNWRNHFDDDQGHGTHIAGIIAARDNGFGVVGVAPEASLYVVKALNAAGSGNFSTVSEGIRACIAHGANVINLSLGSSDESETIRSAVNDALSAGITVVAAAGNEKSPVDFPANIPGVLAVSSMSHNFRFSYFSNRGSNVSFIAPGEDILSTFPGNQYAYNQGTSQASPHVAGVAALLISAGIKDVSEHLEARSLGLDRVYQGHGLIDAKLSLDDREDVR